MSTYKEITKRRNRVYELIVQNRSISIGRLTTLLNVSEVTLRRDLHYLSERGGIQRIHGGVTLKRNNANEPPYIIRSLDMKQEKSAIGAFAATQLKGREVILIDVGTTLLELVKNLGPAKKITIVTNWLPVVLECAKIGNFKVVLLGGDVDLSELSVTGSHPEEILQNYIADAFFMGIGGISLEFGITDYNMHEIMIKRTMMKCARKVVVLADHSKFSRVAPIKICDLQVVHTIITDSGVRDEQRKALEEVGVNLLVAPDSVPTEYAGDNRAVQVPTRIVKLVNGRKE
jgi:DeoR/GlpR family transcriptional regulator of sugar metabolism